MTLDLEAQVRAAEERLRIAQMQNDVQVLDELIAPDLLFTGHLGQPATKADDLAAHQARLLRLTESTPLEYQIRVHSSFAVVSVLMHLVGSYDGAAIDQQMRYTRVWAMGADGSLRLVAGHMSELRL